MKRFDSLCSLVVAAGVATFLMGCGSSSVTGVPTPNDSAPPDAPTAVQLGADDNGRAALVWAASTSPSVSGYEVYEYSPDPSRDNAYVLRSDANPSDQHFTLTTMAPSSSAIFRVRAVSASGVHSAFTPTISVSSSQVSGDVGGGGGGGPSDRGPGGEVIDAP